MEQPKPQAPARLRFELTLDEANLIVEALSQMPFAKVFRLIEKLHLQANAQLPKPPIDDEPFPYPIPDSNS